MLGLADPGSQFEKRRTMQLRNATLGQSEDVGNLFKCESVEVVVANDLLVSLRQLRRRL
jgi:hypothetical protein